MRPGIECNTKLSWFITQDIGSFFVVKINEQTNKNTMIKLGWLNVLVVLGSQKYSLKPIKCYFIFHDFKTH